MEILHLVLNILTDLIVIYVVVTFCLWLKEKFKVVNGIMWKI